MSNKQKSTKTIHALNRPYSEPIWPSITPQFETTVLELLLPLIEPIGQYRKRYKPKSRGKHRKSKSKGNIKDNAKSFEDNGGGNGDLSGMVDLVAAPGPAIEVHLTVGFNSTVRRLEELSQQIRQGQALGDDNVDATVARTLFAVFVCTSTLPSVMTEPLPLLAATASLTSPDDQQIMLVPISSAGATKLAAALGHPRVNVLGICADTPGLKQLEQHVRNHIDPIDVPWIRESADSQYLPVKIYSEEVTDQSKTSKSKKRKHKVEETS